MACARHPGNRSHYVSIVLSIKDLFNIPSDSVPQVYSLSETHSEDVILAPVKQIQIVVVDDVGCVQYLFGELRDASYCLLLLLSLLLGQSLNQRDVLVKRHRGARSLLFEREDSLVRAVLLLLGSLLAVGYS